MRGTNTLMCDFISSENKKGGKCGVKACRKPIISYEMFKKPLQTIMFENSKKVIGMKDKKNIQAYRGVYDYGPK